MADGKRKALIASKISEYFKGDFVNNHIADVEKNRVDKRPRTLPDPSSLVVGAHQWCMSIHNRKIVAARLADLKPDIDRCECFEDIYATIGHRLSDGAGLMNGVGALTLYDISLRVAFLSERDGRTGLLPCRYVYLHRGALSGFINIYGKKTLYDAERLNKNGWRMPIEFFSGYFKDIPAMDIEDILCVMFHKFNAEQPSACNRQRQGCYRI